MDKKEVDKLKNYSWEQQLIYNFEKLEEQMEKNNNKLEEKMDNNNSKIFDYVDKRIGSLHLEIKEGFNKLWDKKDIDTDKIQENEISCKENKIKIDNMDTRVTTLEKQKNNTMSKNFYIVLNIILGFGSSVITGVVVGTVVYFITTGKNP